MKKHSLPIRFAGVVALGIIAIVATVRPSKASIGNVSKSDLAGNWQLTIVGQTGCGCLALKRLNRGLRFPVLPPQAHKTSVHFSKQ